MAEYLPDFATEESVKSRSQQEAWSRGCQNQPQDVTGFWQPWVEHPFNDEWALVFVNEESKTELSVEETAALQSEAEMEAADWFMEA